jgi:glucose/arabinose dehydrogenase
MHHIPKAATKAVRAAVMPGIVLAALPAAAALPAPHPPPGFVIQRIATVSGARELAAAPNGDLFVGTLGNAVVIVPNAEGRRPGTPHAFARVPDAPAAGVALGAHALYIGAQFGVYRVPYHPGERHEPATPRKIASVRTSGIALDHFTTSVAYVRSTLYVSIGSPCNACRLARDSTRATIQQIDLRTGGMNPIATHIRNAIALAIDPATGVLWAGVAGEDDLPVYQPDEIFDAVTLHRLPVDYGWPSCYDNRRHNPRWPGNCAHAALPRVIFPAYETPIGAVFYPRHPAGRYAFPARYRGAAFVTLHGSWHGPAQGLRSYVPPRVIVVPMRNDTPIERIDWHDPDKQWRHFLGAYQNGGTDERIGRPTGIAVAPDGSLFVADDLTGAIYRVRPRVRRSNDEEPAAGMPAGSSSWLKSGADLLSRDPAVRLSLALAGLTAVFGMGTGGSPPLWTPET